MKSLRDAGIALSRIAAAVKLLKNKRGKAWQSAWIVTDGREIYEVTDDPNIVESLSKREVGQLAFSLVAVGAAQAQVQSELGTKRCTPVDATRYDGTLILPKRTANG